MVFVGYELTLHLLAVGELEEEGGVGAVLQGGQLLEQPYCHCVKVELEEGTVWVVQGVVEGAAVVDHYVDGYLLHGGYWNNRGSCVAVIRFGFGGCDGVATDGTGEGWGGSVSAARSMPTM